LSGIIAAFNVLLYEGVFRNPKSKQIRPVLVAIAILIIPCTYGLVRSRTIALRPSLHVGAVQAAVPQEMKNTLEGDYDPEGVLARYVKQTEALPRGKFDLIVWPETIFLPPYTLNVDPIALKDYYSKYAKLAQSTLAGIAQERESYLLTGASTYLPADLGYVADPKSAARIPPGAWDQRYNSAMLFDASGKYVDRYDKMHLVPFGEYVPLPNLLPFLGRLVPFDSSLIPGQRSTIFKIPGNDGTARFGVLICYEDADADLARRLRQTGADFIVNLSNDAWFGASELDQHFVVARFRAIENRVGVLRNGNNGITGIIDPLGRIQNQLGQTIDGKFVMRDVMGHLEGQMWITDTRSLYSYTGDMPVIVVCSLIVLFCVVRKKNDPNRLPVPLHE
jgi:apolipoprotein N-acyltransferase